MDNLKEQLEIEKQQWIENYMKKQVGVFIYFSEVNLSH